MPPICDQQRSGLNGIGIEYSHSRRNGKAAAREDDDDGLDSEG